MKVKKCIICGKIFEAERNRKTCSAECEIKNHRAKAREFSKQRTEKMRALREQYKHENPKTCPECGKTVTRGGNAIYCSPACQYEHALHSKKSSYAEKAVQTQLIDADNLIICGICGKLFKEKNNRKYCSTECSEIARKNASQRWSERKRERDKKLLLKSKAEAARKRGIDAKAADARAAGMSYGQLVALEWMEQQKGMTRTR